MAQFNDLIPHILFWETGTPVASLRRLKSHAEQYALAARKGYHNKPTDKGGPTMCGVTLNTYTAYCRRRGYPRPTIDRLRALPYGQWREILKTTFWDHFRDWHCRKGSCPDRLPPNPKLAGRQYRLPGTETQDETK